MTFAQLCRHGRFLRNEMTQDELAKTTGLTRATIVNIEKGHTHPRLDSAIEIARALGLSLDPLIQDSPPMR